MSSEMPIQPQDQINPKSKLHFNTRIPHCESLAHPCLTDMAVAGANPLSLYRSSRNSWLVRSSWLVLGTLAGAPDILSTSSTEPPLLPQESAGMVADYAKSPCYHITCVSPR